MIELNKCYYITYRWVKDSFGALTNKIKLIKDSTLDLLCKEFIAGGKSSTYPICQINDRIEITVQEGESSNYILFVMDGYGKIFCHFDVQLPFSLDFYIPAKEIEEKCEKNKKDFGKSKYYPRYKDNLNMINAVKRIKKHPNAKQMKEIEQLKKLKI